MKKHKILIIGISSLVAVTGITLGVVFGVRAHRNNIQNQKDQINNEAKKVVADYENKSQLESKNAVVDRVNFSKFDAQMHEVNNINISVLPTDKTKLVVEFVLIHKVSKIASDVQTFIIEGFKKVSEDKESLNKRAKNVTEAKYKEPTENVLAIDAKNENIIFNTVEKGYETVIKGKFPKLNNQTILVINFTLREINGDIESDQQTLEISGFKIPPTPIIPKSVEELNEVASKIKAILYQGEKFNVSAQTLDQSKILISDIPDGYSYKIKKVEAKSDNTTSVIVSFVVSENGGDIESDEKTLEINGFHKPFLDQQKLDEIVEKVASVDIRGLKKNLLLVSEILPNMLTFKGLMPDFEVKVTKISPKADDQITAVIDFTINEKYGSASSKSKTFELTGFKKPKKTKDELNLELAKITKVSYKEQASSLEVLEIEKNKLMFENLDANFKVDIVDLDVKSLEDSTVAIVKYRVYEEDGLAYSDTKVVELSGFKEISEKFKKLKEILSKITVAKYTDQKAFTQISKALKNKFEFEDLDPNYEVMISSVTAQLDDKTKAIIKFKVKEKTSNVTSHEKTLILSGFRKPLLIKDELDIEISKVISLAYPDSLKHSTLVKDINTSLLKLIGKGPNFLFVIKSIKENSKDPSIADVTFVLTELNSRVDSVAKTLEISGFKAPPFSQARLNSVIRRLRKAKYLGNVKETRISNINRSLIDIEDLDKRKFDFNITLVYPFEDDFSIAVVKFNIREKNGSIYSSEVALEISGFNVAALTKDELDKKIDKVSIALFDANKKTTEVTDISTNDIQLSLKDRSLSYKILSIEPKENDDTTAIITFHIKETKGKIWSKSKSLEIRGFKKPSKIKSELNALIKTLNAATYSKNAAETFVKDIDKNAITISGLDETKYTKTISSVTAKPNESGIALITFTIKHKNENTISRNYTIELLGFKKFPKSVDELNKIIDQITSFNYQGSEGITDATNIEKDKIKFNNLDDSLSAEIQSVEFKAINSPIVIVKFVIKEKTGSVKSKVQTIEQDLYKKVETNA